MSNEEQGLEASEITEKSSLLLRQIHPTWIQDGRLGSQSFKPFPKDDGYLSLHEKSKIEPKEAFKIYTEVKELKSTNTVEISVADVNDVDLKAYEDPSEDGPSPEADKLDNAHASIDFNELSNSKIKNKASTLRRNAEDRGFLF